MAPSAGHLLLPKVWRAARFAYEKASKALRSKLPEPTKYNPVQYQPVYARINPRQPISRAAAIRQARSRHFSTHAARAFSSAIRSGLGIDTTTRNTSRIISSISRLNSRAPFASTLRPNLTGGTLGRTAGGYAAGAGRFGGARYFSHGPAAPAQVIHNVSQGVRAFFLSGQKVRFDGVNPRTGEKRYKAISALQHQAEQKMNAKPLSAPGSHIDFHISPTITALSSAGVLGKQDGAPCKTLNSEGLMDLLSADFARALKDFSAVMNDLKRLSSLGDLPIFLHDRSTIRVRFPGCDAETVEQLCSEVGVQRGRIVQDEDFELRTGADLALLFPFAPSTAPPSDTDYYFEKAPLRSRVSLDWQGMMSPASPNSGNAISFEDSELFGANPWKSSSQSYSSINISELGDQQFFPETSDVGLPESTSAYEGIYKFLAECDNAKRS
ncbi:uncharacterized protein N7515_005109 [Penicillium bovifimosum]|uniref:Casein kinase II beta 2 subunit n=1 Tax=Penicillium bovifimosum TaxID=126998 RepID=A0A9W9H2T9_9EURO|nr:uncharacterized protein N7515_005109 [Penicillium bovifimosum]KAJ5135831.1 hypothetical protein N7515_005109 [Penicillium bovifimosum]